MNRETLQTAERDGILYNAVINLPPRTKKNSQRIMTRKNGKPFIMPSNDYKQYEKSAFWDLTIPDKPISEPCCVKCLYYMPTRRNTDLTNLLEATDDILVHFGVLEDDNSKILVSHDGSRVLYDKDNPRTEIQITKIRDNEEPEEIMYKNAVKK